MMIRTRAAGVSCALLIAILTTGCASYMTPGGGVSIPEITTPDVADALSRKPAAVFPRGSRSCACRAPATSRIRTVATAAANTAS